MAVVLALICCWWNIFLLLGCFQSGTATITLTSTLDGRQAACPEEEVTYTCSVTQAFLIGWTAAPFLVDNALVQFAPTDSRMLGCSNSSAIQCDDFDFLATLTSVGVVSMNGAADMTTTFRFTARAELDGTVVECSGTTSSPTPSESNIFTVAGLPSPPRTPSSTVQQYGQDSVTLTVQWQPPQYDGGAPVNYTITVSPSVGTFTISGTSIMVPGVPYNVMHTVSIVATNCNGSSSAAMETIRIVNCSDPTPPMDGSIDPYQNTTEGAEIFFRCNSMFVPPTRMTAICASNRMWTPDPSSLTCLFDCGIPGDPQRGSLESYTNTTEGSEVFYRCDPGLVPEGRMRAVCNRNEWSPNPADLSCNVVNCGVPRVPENGSVENIQSISTVGGAQIVFRCNSGYIPVGRMNATCMSLDGISVVGNWTPDPADLVCNASPIVCGNFMLANGVTVVQPHSNVTVVNSEIVFQCEGMGVTPSSNRSLCGEDGIWSPDPSQVVCRMMNTTPEGVSGGAVAAIVIVLLLVVVLAVAVVIVILWLRKRSDVPPKPQPESEDVAMYSMVEGLEKPAPYTGYMDQGPGTEAEYTVVSDIPTAQSKAAEVHYDLPPGSNHPEGLVYASVDIKPKKPSVYHPKEDDRVEYAAIAYQPKDAAKKSQAAAAPAPKTKRYENADELINLDNLLIQLRDITPMWFDLGDALDLPPSILDDIRGQFETNPEQCMIEMVDAWLQRHLSRGSPTWTEVAEALRKINQNSLADALESVYYTGDLPISVNMIEIPESVFQEGGGTPPPIPIRGTLTDDVEPAPPKPPKSWGTPEKKAPPQHPPRGGSGRRPPPRPPKPSAP